MKTPAQIHAENRRKMVETSPREAKAIMGKIERGVNSGSAPKAHRNPEGLIKRMEAKVDAYPPRGGTDEGYGR